MNNFKIGDKVRCINSTSTYFSKIGMVTCVSDIFVNVIFYEFELGFMFYELEKV